MRNYIDTFFEKSINAPSAFEQYLISIGYIQFTLECKRMTFIKGTDYFSTMMHLTNNYFHKDDVVILDKIAKGLSVMKDISWEDRQGEIVFGLHECGKPPTLIVPRPNIEVIRKCQDGKIRTFNNFYDDDMNVILERYKPEEVYNAIKDKTITLKFDLT